MAVASDNVFPKLILLEGSAPASPSAGDQKLFIDSADHKAKRVNSSGLVTSLEDLVSTKAANYSIVAADNRTLFIANAASLVFTLPAPATAGAGFRVTIANNNQTTTGVKTNTAGVTINGVDSSSTAYTAGLTSAYGSVTLETDATAWFVVAANGTSGGGSSTLAGDTDVSISSPATGDLLRYNGTAWANKALLATSEAVLGTDSTVATASTFQDLVSSSLAAGTYLCIAHATAVDATNSVDWAIRIWDGTTSYGGSEEVLLSAPFEQSTVCFGVVTLSGAGTIKLQGTANATTTVFKAGPRVTSFGSQLTKLLTFKIG